MTSRSLITSLANDITKGELTPSDNTSKTLVPKDNDLFVSAPERMSMIPSPAQAMTILRSLNATDLKNYPLDLLEILLPLLQELLRGDIKLYTSIPHHTFIALNNVVHHVLAHASSHNPLSPYNSQDNNDKFEDIIVNSSHVIMVLRALNAIPSKQLDKNALKRMKYVKEHLVALSFGNPKPISKLLKSQDKNDKFCAQIIKNALSMAYDEDTNPKLNPIKSSA